MKKILASRGFTLIELLVVLLIFSLLALMSYRGLGAVLDAREHVRQETEKWRSMASFFSRFERDVELAAPRSIRTSSGIAPAWHGDPGRSGAPNLEFSRFASADGVDKARRVTYMLNQNNEIELWLWPGLDVASGVVPERYTVLTGVGEFELEYLNADRVWMEVWPTSGNDLALPKAVQLRIKLVSGEEIMRVFAL